MSMYRSICCNLLRGVYLLAEAPLQMCDDAPVREEGAGMRCCDVFNVRGCSTPCMQLRVTWLLKIETAASTVLAAAGGPAQGPTRLYNNANGFDVASAAITAMDTTTTRIANTHERQC